LSEEKTTVEHFEVLKNRNYQATFSGPQSVFVLQDLLKFCKMIHSSFDPEHPHVTSYNEGRRSVILYVLAILQYNEVNLKEILDAHQYQDTFMSSVEGKDDKAKFEDIASAFSNGLHR